MRGNRSVHVLVYNHQRYQRNKPFLRHTTWRCWVKESGAWPHTERYSVSKEGDKPAVIYAARHNHEANVLAYLRTSLQTWFADI